MHLTAKTKVGIGALGVAALTMGLSAPAYADVQPRPTDAVAVGSDTVQYVVDFGADGSPTGLAGYNSTNTSRRIVSFDATADASGRAAYQNNGTPLASSIVLRAGTNPVVRPNGSGAGIAALLADSAHRIDFVRSSRLPKAAEQTQAAGTAGFGAGIHVYQIATDGLQIAVNATGGAPQTNAPAALSCDDLVNIYKGNYKKWSDVPGYTGPAPADGIIPVLPQAGSGTRNDFLANLAACGNGGVAIPLGTNIVTGEEHDPTAITGIAAHNDINGNPVTKADAISPFSTGRDTLIDTGYFGTTPAPNTIALRGGSNYILNRFLYLLCRDADVNATTPFLVGGTLNLAKTLFATPTSWFAKAPNSGLFTAAGVTQSWADKLLASNG